MNQQEELHTRMLEGMSAEERESFKAGLRALGMAPNPDNRQALREAIKRFRPDFTEAMVDTFVAGEVKPTSEFPLFTEVRDEFWPDRIEQLSLAVQELHPGMSDEDIAKWVTSHEGRAVTMKSESPSKNALSIVQDLDAEDAKEAEAQAIPDALRVLHPDWSREKMNEWLAQHDTVITAFKGLHPDWDARMLVLTVLGDESEGG